MAIAVLAVVAAIFLIGKATSRIEVPAVVTSRHWSITVVFEKPVQSSTEKWESDCTGPDCKILSCKSQYTGRDQWVTDKTKVTENAPICKMVDDKNTGREVTDKSSCHNVPDKSSCTEKVDKSTCKLGDDDETHCDTVTVCDTKTVCDKKMVYDKKEVCEAQPNTYGQSATPIYDNMCNVTLTTWVQDGQPYVSSGSFDLPYGPAITNTTIGARQRSYDKDESAVFTQDDGQVVTWNNGLFSNFDEQLWGSLKQGDHMIIVYNGLGSIVEIRRAA